MFYKLALTVTMVLLAWGLVAQVFIPMFRNTPMFPIFKRKSRKLADAERELEGVVEDVDTYAVKKTTEKLKHSIGDDTIESKTPTKKSSRKKKTSK